MYRQIDESTSFKDFLKRLSASLAAARGLPILTAIGFTVLSLVIHVIYAATGNPWIGLIGFIVLHVAILIGFLGLLLAEPLGHGS